MKYSLTICVITGRDHPREDWLFHSLQSQLLREEWVHRFIIVDAGVWAEDSYLTEPHWPCLVQIVSRPKPTIWQGEHRVTREDWWAASNARNTGLALADTEWIWFLDDRLVLGEHCVQSLREAMEANYAVFGSYEKRHGMRVENGVIVEPGVVTGEDDRMGVLRAIGHPLDQPRAFGPEWGAGWGYGCCVALPVRWALQVGGFEQAMDGHGFEDVIFGMMLGNSGLPLRYDPRMRVIEDRTPDKCGKVYRKEDKGVSPHDKSHRSLELFGKAFQTSNRAQLLQSRAAVLRGEPWPVLLDPLTDWWDGERIGENYMSQGSTVNSQQ